MRFKEEEKAMWLDDWRQSGKSTWSYAKANGLNPQTFANWTKSKEAEVLKTPFVEVPVQALISTKNHPEILIEKGDVRIHIPVSVGCSELRAVMEGLGRVL
jgi:hypothetical protein